MPLELTRKDGETWKEAALRLAKKYGLEVEVEATYDHNIKSNPDYDAAFCACYEWDILDYVEK